MTFWSSSSLLAPRLLTREGVFDRLPPSLPSPLLFFFLDLPEKDFASGSSLLVFVSRFWLSIDFLFFYGFWIDSLNSLSALISTKCGLFLLDVLAPRGGEAGLFWFEVKDDDNDGCDGLLLTRPLLEFETSDGLELCKLLLPILCILNPLPWTTYCDWCSEAANSAVWLL